MARFTHHPNGRIWIDGALVRLDAFMELEPGYGLPAGAIGRRDRVLTNGRDQWADDFDPAPYVARLPEYQARSVEMDTPPPDPLPQARINAKAIVDSDAETARAQWATPGAGQAMTYLHKVREADAYQAVIDAAGTPAPANYPLLNAEAGIRAPDLAGAVALVQRRHGEWIAAGAQIERIRLQAKKDIDDAADAAAVRAVLNALDWPTPA